MKTNTQNQVSELKNRPEQLSTASKTQLPKLDFALRQRNRQMPTKNLLQLLQTEAPEFRRVAHVVGQWVWIQFQKKQPQGVTSTLSQFGFHWNKRRQLWQHPCGFFTSQRADYDPRRRYGSHVPQTN
ncbi:MAG TPA: hypothetical protein VG347_10955 [Verrucomicrobiae bacterium]|nr:hypothetical protein [Verrucomicrobiae bacterium]